jgi:ribose transport system substrate-binding protein
MHKVFAQLSSLALALTALGHTSCSRGADSAGGPNEVLVGNGFEIVATRTDDFVATTAKANAEDILVKHEDLAGMVGLFAYNAPACLEALKGAQRVGAVKVAAFDEQSATLDGIAAGEVVGTVSQEPFQYGYHSVRILAALCRGDESVLPPGGVLTTETTVVTQANVAEFRARLNAAIESGKAEPPAGGDGPRIAYVTNGVDPFWDVAAAGARAAAAEFDVRLEIVFPSPGTIEVQRQKVQDLLVRGLDGLAISPIDGTNMTPFLDEISGRVKLVTHDSDAPTSKRLCFIGIDNLAAGRACGELLRKALPNGGKVALFVGRLEQDNARKRRQGVIEALVGQ